jgi:hypothetical protein
MIKRTVTFALSLLLLTLTLNSTANAQVNPEERFRRFAETDVFPEVRQAAANVLADIWAESTISVENLTEIANNGLTEELRGAAANAIAMRTVTASLSSEALQQLIIDGEFEQIRQLAAERLAQLLLDTVSDVGILVALATDENEAVRQAAVSALSAAWFESNVETIALAEIAVNGETVELRQAAANAVVQRLDNLLIGQSTTFLLDLAQGGTLNLSNVLGQNSDALRSAAAEALRAGFVSQDTSIFDVEAVAADPNNSAQLRQVAAEVLRQRLLRERRTLEELLALADEGATPEVQSAAIDALEQALVTEVGLGNLALQDLVDQISSSETDAANTARANAVYTMLRPNLIFVTDQPLLEAVLRRETVQIGEALIDGTNDFLRQAGVEFLAGLFLQFGAVNRFEDPLVELQEMASDTTLEQEFRTAAGLALVKFLSAQRSKALDVVNEIGRILDRISIQGRRGQTEEALQLLEDIRILLDSNQDLIATTAEAAGDLGVPLRFRTIRDLLAEFPDAIRSQNTSDLRDINNIISGQLTQISVSIAGAPETTDDDLIELAGTGTTPEARQAAATVLVGRLEDQLANDETDVETLQDLATNGASEELQTATISALTQAFVASDLSDDDLLTLTLDGTTNAVQQAAAAAWTMRQPADESLFTDLANGSGLELGEAPVAFASEEFSHALRELIQASLVNDGPSTDVLISQAQDESIPVLQQAAGALLPESLLADGLTQAELIQLAAESESAVVREAASVALSAVLISQLLPEGALFGLISTYTLAVNNVLSSQELAHALVVAMTERFRNPLLDSVNNSGNQPSIGQGVNN